MMQFDWQDLFDEVKRRGSFVSDAELSTYLSVTRAQISAWRNGKSDLGTLTKLKLLHALGYDNLDPIMHSLWPADSHEERVQQHLRLVERVRAAQPMRRATKLLSAGGVSLGANHLLAALPDAELKRLQPHLVDVSLALGMVVHEPGDDLLRAYLPTTAVFTVLHVLGDGTPAETAVVGRDGFTGMALTAGGQTIPSKTIVQCTGHAFCLDSSLIDKHFRSDGPFRHVFLRSTQMVIAQMAEATICKARHTLAQRLCRWILLSEQQVDGSALEMSVDVLSEILGDPPTKIVAEARKLHTLGAIRYAGKSSKSIDVLDKAALQARVCTCYGALDAGGRGPR